MAYSGTVTMLRNVIKLAGDVEGDMRPNRLITFDALNDQLQQAVLGLIIVDEERDGKGAFEEGLEYFRELVSDMESFVAEMRPGTVAKGRN